ncbi:DUF6111 family protein [Maricaulis sp. CAU 1757]
MLRITLLEIGSFLLPFLIFFIWRWQSRSPQPLTATPTLKLAAAGAALAVVMMIGLVVIETLRGGHEGDRYVPPRMVDGEIVPGHFERVEDEEPEDSGTPPQ